MTVVNALRRQRLIFRTITSVFHLPKWRKLWLIYWCTSSRNHSHHKSTFRHISLRSCATAVPKRHVACYVTLRCVLWTVSSKIFGTKMFIKCFALHCVLLCLFTAMLLYNCCIIWTFLPKVLRLSLLTTHTHTHTHAPTPEHTHTHTHANRPATNQARLECLDLECGFW